MTRTDAIKALERAAHLDGGPGSGVIGHTTEKQRTASEHAGVASAHSNQSGMDPGIAQSSHLEAANAHGVAAQAHGETRAGQLHTIAKGAHEQAALAQHVAGEHENATPGNGARALATYNKKDKDLHEQASRLSETAAQAGSVAHMEGTATTQRAPFQQPRERTQEEAQTQRAAYENERQMLAEHGESVRRTAREHNQLHGFTIRSR